eukprot:m.29531 g.29531  ORF g.29531 m.29531 type:complete len:125 (+) comp16104_c2_seq1:519-893(+)
MDGSASASPCMGVSSVDFLFDVCSFGGMAMELTCPAPLPNPAPIQLKAAPSSSSSSSPSPSSPCDLIDFFLSSHSESVRLLFPDEIDFVEPPNNPASSLSVVDCAAPNTNAMLGIANERQDLAS